MKFDLPTLYSISLTAVLFAVLLFSYQLILFIFTFGISILFGIFLFLELNLSNVAKDYEIFNRKQNDSIHIIKCDHHARNYVDDSMKNDKITLINKLELNKKFATNDPEINNQLNEVFELIIKNHINIWFRHISQNQEFPYKLYQCLNHTVASFIKRLRRLDFADLIINKLVDEITKHKRLYRMTKLKLEYKIHSNEELIQMFFNIERKSEKTYAHEKVCLDQESFFQYMSRICDILQYSLFPVDSFRNETLKIITKDIFIKLILYPLFETLSEPDFVNKIIISMLKSNYPTTETFLSVLQSTDDVNELRSVLESVEEEIMFVRSKDQDVDELKMKQQLNSLVYLKKIIQSHLKKFEDDASHSGDSNYSNSNSSGKTSTTPKSSPPDKRPEEKIISISFDTILRHNVALGYFIEYMTSINAEHYINFYLNVQTFKISIEQGLFDIYLSSLNDSVTNEQYQQLQNDVRVTALNIYETYLSGQSPSHLRMIDQDSCQQLYKNLMSDDSSLWMNDNLFDDIFFQVRDLILNYREFYPSFRKSKYYRKLLGEPDLLRDSLDDDETEIHVEQCKKENGTTKSQQQQNGFDIEIIDTGILNLQGKPFIGYLINVEKKNGDNWTILRRYSEFFNFHQLMLEKCEKFQLNVKSILFLPPKTVLSNRMNENFIQYRKHMLNVYLKKLNYLHEKFIFLREDIEKFLTPGNYDANASKNLMLNPIKTIGNVFKNQSENLLDGFQRLSRTLSLQTDLNKTAAQQENKRMFQTNSLGTKSTVAEMKRNSDSSNDLSTTVMDWNNYGSNEQCDSIPSDYEENFPLLLLLDEVFDLKRQNFWLRRRIIELFKQIVEVAFTETINKKMIDYINEWTSPTSIVNYLESFKNVFWPDGHTAKSVVRRPENCQRRKVAAKALILTFLSDLKRVVGNETLQSGLISFFELFQNKTLNMRLIFVLFEIILKELFPDNYLDDIFTRLYGAFDDKSSVDEIKQDWPPYLSKFVAKS